MFAELSYPSHFTRNSIFVIWNELVLVCFLQFVWNSGSFVRWQIISSTLNGFLVRLFDGGGWVGVCGGSWVGVGVGRRWVRVGGDWVGCGSWVGVCGGSWVGVWVGIGGGWVKSRRRLTFLTGIGSGHVHL